MAGNFDGRFNVNVFQLKSGVAEPRQQDDTPTFPKARPQVLLQGRCLHRSHSGLVRLVCFAARTQDQRYSQYSRRRRCNVSGNWAGAVDSSAERNRLFRPAAKVFF